MVGVAGRSKTCKTCKKRRIACSLERPACSTCINSSRECGGYKDAPIFILDHRCKATRPTKNKSPSKQEASDIYINNLKGLPAKPDAKREEAKLERTITTKEAYKSLWHLSSPPMRAVYRQQILSEFLCNYPQSAPEPKAGSWLALLPGHPTYTTALEAAILAVCTAKLGRMNNDRSLVHESLKFYIQGLWELQKALWDDKLMYKDETAAACMCLIMYEVMECPDKSPKGCTGHMRGCARLFELRGPKAYNSEFGHRLFISFRQLEIQQAITERRSTFLSKDEWLSIPWKYRPKHISQQFLDLMAETTGIIESSYQTIGNQELQARPDILLLMILEIVNRCWKLDTRMRAFYRRLESETAGPVFWSKLSAVPVDISESPESANVFPVAFQFPSVGMAHICMVYWATSSILWSGLKVLYSLLAVYQAQIEALAPSGSDNPIPGFNLSELPPLEHRIDATVLAKNICQSVEFCTLPTSGQMTPISAVFPMKVAIEILGNDPACERESIWALDAMEKIRSGTGVRILGHVGLLTERCYIPG